MKILFIEDEPGIVAVVELGFRRVGLEIDTACDGEFGLELAENGSYDLIIMDYMLPKLNGKEICRQLRAVGDDTPIVMLTVRCNMNDKVEMLNLGVDDYITKPFSIDELVSRAKAITRRCNSNKSHIKNIAGLVIDIQRGSVDKDGEEVKLTRREFEILEYFIKNENKLISREEFSRAIWGEGFNSASHTIRMHVAKLRKKIDTSSSRKLIHTSYRKGYVFGLNPGKKDRSKLS